MVEEFFDVRAPISTTREAVPLVLPESGVELVPDGEWTVFRCPTQTEAQMQARLLDQRGYAPVTIATHLGWPVPWREEVTSKFDRLENDYPTDG